MADQKSPQGIVTPDKSRQTNAVSKGGPSLGNEKQRADIGRNPAKNQGQSSASEVTIIIVPEIIGRESTEQQINVPAKTLIKDLKVKVRESLNYEEDKQDLSLKGEIWLKDSTKTIDYYGIGNGDKIILRLKICVDIKRRGNTLKKPVVYDTITLRELRSLCGGGANNELRSQLILNGRVLGDDDSPLWACGIKDECEIIIRRLHE